MRSKLKFNKEVEELFDKIIPKEFRDELKIVKVEEKYKAKKYYVKRRKEQIENLSVKMKKRIKEYIKKEIQSIYIGVISSFFTLILIIGILFLSNILVSKNISSDFGESVLYEFASDKYLDDKINDIVYKVCRTKDKDIEKVICVYDIFLEFYEYDDFSDLRNTSLFLSPSKMFFEKGVCRDSAVFFCSAFKRLGIQCKFIHLESHVLNILQLNEGYCVLDQTLLKCANYERDLDNIKD